MLRILLALPEERASFFGAKDKAAGVRWVNQCCLKAPPVQLRRCELPHCFMDCSQLTQLAAIKYKYM
jgi:hypothetical protein